MASSIPVCKLAKSQIIQILIFKRNLNYFSGVVKKKNIKLWGDIGLLIGW